MDSSQSPDSFWRSTYIRFGRYLSEPQFLEFLGVSKVLRDTGGFETALDTSGTARAFGTQEISGKLEFQRTFRSSRISTTLYQLLQLTGYLGIPILWEFYNFLLIFF